MKKNIILVSALSFCLALTVFVTGCSASSNSGGGNAGSAESPELSIAVLPTEDSLPLWAAEASGLFDQEGLKVKLESFQSAQELTAAITSGASNLAVTDPIVAASLTAGGTPMTLEWVTLGITPEEGRFGIMTSPNSGITKLEQLKGVPIGIGSNTIVEYIMDSILTDAGFLTSDIKKEEIKKIPVRYESMANGSIKAAALPSSTLAVGEATGMVLLADDTKGKNLTQSTLIASNALLAQAGAQDALNKLETVWNIAAEAINNSPEQYRQLLIKKASLPDVIAGSYPISHYPQAIKPTSEMIDPVLAWMQDKGYLKTSLIYNPATGSFGS